MKVVETRDALRQGLAAASAEGATRALVPTMGFLHEGHLSLVDRARELADLVVVSIFVNPMQFAPGEDLERYPRDRERDLAMLQARQADIAFVPTVEEMYPRGEPRVTVAPGALARRLCGAFRPGHFRGVLTVVARLFGLVRPDLAVFGSKDFQQGVLIRQMAQDLEMGVDVVLGRIVREEDGLALSTRNRYLDAEERQAATALSRVLVEARERYAEGQTRATPLLDRIRAEIRAQPLLELQYVEAVSPMLDPVEELEDGSVLALAVFCGTTRLIDNVELG